MIKVIEHGYSKYKDKCHQCGCLFEYELEDIKEGSVKCPDCEFLCNHNYTLNVNFTSRIKEVQNG
jgi:DNA-directed RNA polymerase subunit RPC12/RpoP